MFERRISPEDVRHVVEHVYEPDPARREDGFTRRKAT
jgi:hypothetical protein